MPEPRERMLDIEARLGVLEMNVDKLFSLVNSISTMSEARMNETSAVAVQALSSMRDSIGEMSHRLGAPRHALPTGAPVTLNAEHRALLVGEVPFAAVVRAVSRVSSVSEADILSKVKLKRVSRARRAVVWIARLHSMMSYPQIAAALGHADHTSAMYADKKAREEYPTDDAFRELADRSVGELRSVVRTKLSEVFR